MAELMMQVESKDLESTKIRLEQIQKQFKAEMEQEDAYAERGLYRWIKLLAKNNFSYRDKRLQSEGLLLLEDEKMELMEDSQLLNYKAWIRKKIKA
jgi:hypothetical protein